MVKKKSPPSDDLDIVRSLYLRYTDVKGLSRVDEHRVFGPADKFLKRVTDDQKKEGGTVQVITKEVYDGERFSKAR